MKPRYPLNFKPGNGPFFYRKVPADSVDDAARQTAEKALEFFSRDLELSQPYPSVQWIFPEAWQNAEREIANPTTGPAGQYFASDIVIRGETPFNFKNEILMLAIHESGRPLDGCDLIRLVAHELRHVWQEKERGSAWRRNQADAAEDDAFRYEDEAVLRYPEYQRLVDNMEFEL